MEFSVFLRICIVHKNVRFTYKRYGGELVVFWENVNLERFVCVCRGVASIRKLREHEDCAMTCPGMNSRDVIGVASRSGRGAN